jgi:hypothetical protein
VVVHRYVNSQLHPWHHCRHHTKHHDAGLGLCDLAAAGNVYRAVGKSSMQTETDKVTNRLQSTLLYSRYGNGIATNNLSKMLAGLILPERPIGNMYFAAWSHNVINNAVQLSSDLKMGEYRMVYLHFQPDGRWN